MPELSGPRKETVSDVTTANSEWLTVWVRDMPLALPLDDIREVMLWVPWQPGPPAQPGVVGIINVRGTTWPVWDLSRLWGWNPRDPQVETSYVLMEDGDNRPLGAVIVDRVGWIVEAALVTEGKGLLDARFLGTIAAPETSTDHYVTRLAELTV